ncbi:unnamed protein product [Cyprideis torosa]|uniref:Uncharacterized protein n=1 Tax=Cyprideis torosa TaxID=163714 RepID=A0A7R8WB47_9CRUS|nr:unnamed protein product [Cyprideis torosa]CAG0890425.1 unnamed protein product [Cyprideis torosa]
MRREREIQRIRRTNKLLSSITGMFCLSWLPLNVFNLLWDTMDLMADDKEGSRTVFALCHMVGMSSACINPLLYGWLNENFQKEFRQVFRSCHCGCCSDDSVVDEIQLEAVPSRVYRKVDQVCDDESRKVISPGVESELPEGNLHVEGNGTGTLDMEFSVKEGATLAVWFDICGSVTQVQRRFRNEFNDRNRVPGKNQEPDIVHSSTGSVFRKKRGPDPGAPTPPRRTNSPCCQETLMRGQYQPCSTALCTGMAVQSAVAVASRQARQGEGRQTQTTEDGGRGSRRMDEGKNAVVAKASPVLTNPTHLFECFCEVVAPSSANPTPFILQKFPETYVNEEVLKPLPGFTFPCEIDVSTIEHFSFVLTNSDSKWAFGFTRHTPGMDTALVFISFLPWHSLFFKLLNKVADLINRDTASVSQFLSDAYILRMPSPGSLLKVPSPVANDGSLAFSCVCPDHTSLPTIPENRNLVEYYNAVSSEVMLEVFASMLHERRIVMVSRKLSRLTGCVQAANLLIEPMYWQHIFIPVLPFHLVDYLSAPMPFLVGVPRSTMEKHVRKAELGDAVIVDLDDSVVHSPYGDLKALPSEVVSGLRRKLTSPQLRLGDGIARSFLIALVQLIGGYREALVFRTGQKITFDRSQFLQTRQPSMRPFLQDMLQLQIFQQFIDERLAMLNAGEGFSDQFELEACLYSEKSSAGLKTKYTDWRETMKREGGALLRSVKDKVQSASMSVLSIFSVTLNKKRRGCDADKESSSEKTLESKTAELVKRQQRKNRVKKEVEVSDSDDESPSSSSVSKTNMTRSLSRVSQSVWSRVRSLQSEEVGCEECCDSDAVLPVDVQDLEELRLHEALQAPDIPSVEGPRLTRRVVSEIGRLDRRVGFDLLRIHLHLHSKPLVCSGIEFGEVLSLVHFSGLSMALTSPYWRDVKRAVADVNGRTWSRLRRTSGASKGSPHRWSSFSGSEGREVVVVAEGLGIFSHIPWTWPAQIMAMMDEIRTGIRQGVLFLDEKVKIRGKNVRERGVTTYKGLRHRVLREGRSKHFVLEGKKSSAGLSLEGSLGAIHSSRSTVSLPEPRTESGFLTDDVGASGGSLRTRNGLSDGSSDSDSFDDDRSSCPEDSFSTSSSSSTSADPYGLASQASMSSGLMKEITRELQQRHRVAAPADQLRTVAQTPASSSAPSVVASATVEPEPTASSQTSTATWSLPSSPTRLSQNHLMSSSLASHPLVQDTPQVLPTVNLVPPPLPEKQAEESSVISAPSATVQELVEIFSRWPANASSSPARSTPAVTSTMGVRPSGSSISRDVLSRAFQSDPLQVRLVSPRPLSPRTSCSASSPPRDPFAELDPLVGGGDSVATTFLGTTAAVSPITSSVRQVDQRTATRQSSVPAMNQSTFPNPSNNSNPFRYSPPASSGLEAAALNGAPRTAVPSAINASWTRFD